MSRRAAAFTQADVARALRAAEQVKPGAFEVSIVAPDGTMIRVAPRLHESEQRSPPVPVAPEKDWRL